MRLIDPKLHVRGWKAQQALRRNDAVSANRNAENQGTRR